MDCPNSGQQVRPSSNRAGMTAHCPLCRQRVQRLLSKRGFRYAQHPVKEQVHA